MTFGIAAMIIVGASWTIFGGVMGKAPKEAVNISVLIFWTLLSALLVSLVCGFFQGFPQASANGLLIAFGSQIVSGLFNFWQLELMSRAMQKGHNGIVWSIVQSGFIFPFFMGIIFFGVPLTWVRAAALLLALASIALSGISQGRAAGKWVTLALLSFLITGVSQSASNFPSYFSEAESVSSIWRTAALACGFILGAFTCNLGSISRFGREIVAGAKSLTVWKYCLILEGIDIVTNYFFLYPGMDALSRASAGAVAYPLMVSSCLLVFDLYSLIVLREKHSFIQWLALVLCILAVIGLSLP